VTEEDIGLKVLHDPAMQEPTGTQAQIIEYASLSVSLEFFLTGYSIVAIHGIGAHPDDTWCKKVDTNGITQYVNWLKDGNMLPSVAPNARVLRYGYESKWYGENAIFQKTSTVAKRFLVTLRRERKVCIRGPPKHYLLTQHPKGVSFPPVDIHSPLLRWASSLKGPSTTSTLSCLAKNPRPFSRRETTKMSGQVSSTLQRG
jgi:hypothetical protein